MADPVGIVGTAVGIVSLGLQLYDGIATYFDALDGRKDDLASARAQLNSLRESLNTIQSALPSSSTTSTGAGVVPPIVTECKNELDQLEVLLQELVGSSHPSNKLKERIKTLKFPFRRDNLMKLEDRLHKTNSVFQTALSVLNLNKSLDNDRRFANVEAATAHVPTISTNVVQMSADVQDIRTDISQISHNVDNAISTLDSSSSTMTSLAENFATFAPATTLQLGEIHQDMATLALQDDVQELARTSVHNSDILSRVDLSVTQLVATAGQSLPQISNSIASIERHMQSISALEQRLQALSYLEQALDIQDGQAQDNPQLALQRLLAKPSQTREIYDSMSNSLAMTSYHGSSTTATYGWTLNTRSRSQPCSCLYRSNRKSTSRRFGSLWLRTETSHHGHGQDCELSSLNIQKSRRWFGLTAAKPSSFLPWAVRLSFGITTGAGGFSISPGITMRPVVDERQSPVFRILETLQCFLFYQAVDNAELSLALSITKDIILRLYGKKKASAYETDRHGNSAVLIMVNQQLFVETISDFILDLVQAGLPGDVCNFAGSETISTPLSLLAVNGSAIHTKELLPTLYNATSDPEHNDPGFGFEMKELTNYHEPNDPSLKAVYERIRVEIFGCGPLTAAISGRRSAREINDLITANTAREVNFLGQTAWHLAAGTGNTNMARNHAVEYAAAYSGRSCSKGREPVLCSGCSCTSALDVLLRTEGYFDGYLERISRGWWWSLADIFSLGSHSAKRQWLIEIKLRRADLKRLALAYLGAEDIKRYKIDGDRVLDYHGIRVVKCLTNMGIKVPARLQNSFFGLDRYLSVYHMLLRVKELDRNIAQLLFDLGFHDIDEPDELGSNTVMELYAHGRGGAGTLLWFVEHGIDLQRSVSCTTYKGKHTSPLAAHLVSCGWQYHPLSITSEDVRLISTMIPVDGADMCQCFCTETGCTTASIYFHEIWLGIRFIAVARPHIGFWHQQWQTTEDVVSKLAVLFVDHDIDMTSHRHVCLAALRMLTFEALGIRHTCGFRLDSVSDDDVENIWEEDTDLIMRLTELQIEWETSFDDSGMTFDTFLIEKWAPRMEIVFRELDDYELTETERKDAEALGVEWGDTCEAQHDEQDYDIRDPCSLQDYLKAIRKIADE
ncbi:hypothetical protein PFICI_08031 [Pestalotiopsis fici W106-1]|uniref:Fungal N-terminal domain-containing protein n=1 Tax=Pestalotiopsis fici (strain W106-1 / CGMCC3.15140) TaxID=1229662 RepID=W3X510_PESFW|nr:uncharacterized protein PFICI_08031 [Pestalotiopsis fici W106-1]ETS80502.1 hypothetical protein PFICI_08031 [Pestalotiopsis fici W106-1]